MRISNKVLKPIITEKSFRLAEENKYIFSVGMELSKGSIAQEVERLFDVNVVNVNTIIMPGKRRRVLRTRKWVKTPRWKKAVVEIKEGQKIDLVQKENE